MKFITEEDLRDLYRKQPFTDYDLQEGERLTPGARQFLVDRGINMYDKENPCKPVTVTASGDGTVTFNEVAAGKPLECKNNRKLCAQMKSLKSLFLLTAQELLSRDVCLSQQVTGLYRQFASLGAASEGKCETADLCCRPCSGINGDNFSQCLGDCFEITEFHMQMPKGKEMLMLDRLRSELELFDIELDSLIANEELQKNVSGKLNQIINTLSQMICTEMGGNECQRKI